jgi:hypothetical protein
MSASVTANCASGASSPPNPRVLRSLVGCGRGVVKWGVRVSQTQDVACPRCSRPGRHGCVPVWFRGAGWSSTWQHCRRVRRSRQRTTADKRHRLVDGLLEISGVRARRDIGRRGGTGISELDARISVRITAIDVHNQRFSLGPIWTHAEYQGSRGRVVPGSLVMQQPQPDPRLSGSHRESVRPRYATNSAEVTRAPAPPTARGAVPGLRLAIAPGMIRLRV